MRSVPPGSKSRAKAHLGFPRNVGDPVASAANPGRRYRVNNSGPGAMAFGRDGSETRVRPWYRQAKATKRGGRGVRKSQRLDSTVETGELGPEDPGEGSEASRNNTVGGKHGGDIGLRDRVNATTTDSGVGEASSAEGIDFAEPPPRSGVAPRGLPAHPQGRGRGGGGANVRRGRGAPGGQPSVASGAGEVRHVPGTAGATGLHPQGRLDHRDAPDRDSPPGGQNPYAGDRPGAGADLRAGFSGMLLRLSAWTVGAPGAGQPLDADDAERRRTEPRNRHPDIFRHAGSCPPASPSPTEGSRRGGAPFDRQVAQRGRDGSRGGDVPGGRIAPGRGDLPGGGQRLPALRGGRVVP